MFEEEEKRAKKVFYYAIKDQSLAIIFDHKFAVFSSPPKRRKKTFLLSFAFVIKLNRKLPARVLLSFINKLSISMS